MDLYDLLKLRHTVRVYAARPVPDEVLQRLLEAAVLAPNAHNRQPWRFVVVKSEARRQHLANAMADAWASDLEADRVHPQVASAWLNFSQQRFSTAPALVLACLTMEEMDRYPDALRQQAEHTMAIQSVAAAIENLLLAAAGTGLGGCWCCAPLFCPDVVRQVLDLPATWEPQALITLGYPRHAPQGPERPYRDRRPLESVVRVV